MKTFSFSGVMAVLPLLWRKHNTVTLGKVLNRGKETKGLTERETTVCFLKLIQEKLTLLNAVNTKNNTRGGTYWKLLENPGQEEASKLIGRFKKNSQKVTKSLPDSPTEIMETGWDDVIKPNEMTSPSSQKQIPLKTVRKLRELG